MSSPPSDGSPASTGFICDADHDTAGGAPSSTDEGTPPTEPATRCGRNFARRVMLYGGITMQQRSPAAS